MMMYFNKHNVIFKLFIQWHYIIIIDHFTKNLTFGFKIVPLNSCCSVHSAAKKLFSCSQ